MPEEPNPSVEQLKALIRRPLFWLIVVGIVLVGLLTQGNPDALEGLVPIGGAIVLYFIPSFAARGKPNFGSVFTINLLLGWTLIGWVVAMAMAVSKPTQVVVQQVAAPAAVTTGRVCPFCAEQIQPAALVCKHCGRDLPTESP